VAGLFIRSAAFATATFQIRKESSRQLRGVPIQSGALVEAAPEAIASGWEDFVHALVEFALAGKHASHGRHS